MTAASVEGRKSNPSTDGETGERPGKAREALTLPFLLEVGCEEIPARFLHDAERGLGERVHAALTEARLLPATDASRETEVGAVREAPLRTYSTPRRLVVHLPALLARQPEKVEEIVGPPLKVAVDADGKYTRAAESFTQKNSARLEDLVRTTTPKGEYLALRKTTQGRSAQEMLPGILPTAILGLSFPKSMYWMEKSGPRFVRPIRWVLAVLGEGKQAEAVNFEILGVKSGDFTFGHRVHSKGRMTAKGFSDYRAKLRRAYVELDRENRRQTVQEKTNVLLEDFLVLVDDTELEEWVVNSTEWPSAIRGGFDERFLRLPREILITVMRDHQKYFAVENRQGKLEPYFVATLNVDSDERGLIRQGHERVLQARFRDAEFFWDADQRTPLRDRVPLLENVTYQAELGSCGSYADKVRRMEASAKEISRALEGQGKVTAPDTQHALRAVQLCKCDLTTQMVREFTELQGVVGGLYAREQGESPEVAAAVYDHYLPQRAEDKCPQSLVGAVVSLADKIDSVAAGFEAGLEPTGSADPFALRRAGNGIIKLAVEVLVGLDLTALTNRIFDAQAVSAGAQAVLGRERLNQKVDDFLRERMEFYFRETAGLRYDTVRAVLRPSRIFQDLVPSAALSRARALERVRDSEDFMALAAAAKRTRNIRKSADAADILEGQPDPALFVEDPERELYAAYQTLSQRIEQLSESGDFEEAFRAMATLRPHVDRFFDKVLVMTEDAALRRNRLKLLMRLNEDMFTSLADLAEIVFEQRSVVGGRK
jgi:glycyl-tRNA synthetase beta chain